MAVNNAANVGAVKGQVGAYILSAVAGTTLPTDAGTPLSSVYGNLGYASEDGLKNEVEEDEEKKKDWNAQTIATIQSESNESFTFKLMETKEEVLKEVFGYANVTTTGGVLKVASNANERPARIFVFETELPNNRMQRIVVPNGKAKLESEIEYKGSDATGYELKVTCLPDASDNRAYRYIEAFEKYATQGEFPQTGQTGVVYIATSTGKRYRWSNNAYTEIQAPQNEVTTKKSKK